MKRLVLYFAAILILSYSILFFFSKETVIYLTQEDGISEWIGALCLFASFIVFLLLFIKSKKSLKSVYYIMFCLVFLFGFGEEINYGQRIFGLEAPEFLNEKGGSQLNIHNLPSMERNASGERRMFAFVRIINICWLLYLFVLPIVNKYSVKIQELINKFKLPVSPIWVGVFFILNQILFRICLSYFPGNLFNPDEINLQYIAEIQEFNLSLLLLFFSLSVYNTNLSRQ